MSGATDSGLFASPGGEAPVHAAGQPSARRPAFRGVDGRGASAEPVGPSPYAPTALSPFAPGATSLATSSAGSADAPASPYAAAAWQGATASEPGDASGLGGAAPRSDGPSDDGWMRGPQTMTRRSRRRGRAFATGLSFVVVGVVAGASGAWVSQSLPTARPLVGVTVADRDASTDRPAGSVAAVAAKVMPSVVSFEISSPDGESTGSGFVFSSDGYIVTNNHVVESAVAAGKAGRVVVVLADGSEVEGEVVGSTVGYDLAVVRIDHDGLVPLVLGNSDALVVGDPVTAFGAPLGLAGTVTTGIVSAVNRPVVAGGGTETAFINAVQTDASINPGNSGGPLVNAAGEVVGINSAIAQPPGIARAAGSIGLGFAIPSNQALRTVTQLIETGEATYPIIGVLLDRTYEGEGVRVVQRAQGDQLPVSPGTPADRAGIRPGDVILAIDGRPVTRPDELVVAIRAHAPGDVVTLTVREGADGEKQVRMVLDEAAKS